MRRVADLVMGLVLTRALDAFGRWTPRARSARRAAPSPREATPSRPLLAVVVGSFAVGAPLVVLFDSTFLRVLGALILCGFIVAGVFLVADPDFLAPDEE